MALNPFYRIGYRTLGARAERSIHLQQLEEDLRRAHMTVRADAFLGFSWIMGAFAGLVTGIGCIAFFVFMLAQGVEWFWGLLLLLIPILVGYGVFTMTLTHPQRRAAERKRHIDNMLPYAAHYVTAMASAGVIPAEIFKSLAQQTVYGEVAKEAAWIYKDLSVHGRDVVTAMRRGIDRTPSEKFKDFLQGGITTVTSGGDLTAYFHIKARRLQTDNQETQKKFMETMGVMSEAYVAAGVALPLFLLIMVALFVLIGVIPMLWMQAVVYAFLPLLAGAFLGVLWIMKPEV